MMLNFGLWIMNVRWPPGLYDGKRSVGGSFLADPLRVYLSGLCEKLMTGRGCWIPNS